MKPELATNDPDVDALILAYDTLQTQLVTAAEHLNSVPHGSDAWTEALRVCTGIADQLQALDCEA